ncbi:ATP-binding protein [Lysinibacillus sp. BW-2-10]|uniref:ATP-binding protein n=1 Tax=Lysinibacillus sp. BW-2-10 TaxID=2590030 RepID=UPI001642D94A|nr:ATP-binding protein [Lysinibacillus sp. BW-2-10]
MKRKLIAYISVPILIALLLIMVLSAHNPAKLPAVQNGILDLTGIDLEQVGPIALDGEWEFVSGQLVNSDYFNNQGSSTLVNVPSLWTKYAVNGESILKYNKATYRMVVKLPKDQSILGLKTGNIRMSNSLYVNGEKVGGSGTPADATTYSQRNTPYTALFQPKGDELEIIVHVANFDYASGGGIVSSLYLGDDESILNIRTAALAYDWVMIAALFAVGIYFFGFYLHFPRERSLLFLALFCFSMALYTSTHGEKVLDTILPGIPYELFSKIQGTSNLIALFLVAYFHSTLKEYSNKSIVKFLVVIGVLLSCSVLLPLKISSHLQNVYSIYLFVALLYIFSIQIKAIRNKTVGGMYLLLGSLTLIIYCIVGTLNVIGNTKIDSLPPIFPFIYLMMLSLFMAHRFTDTYRKNEELTEKLIEVDRFKDEFLTKTSHEFKTPLHGMIAILQTVAKDLNGKQQEKIHFVISQAKRLSSLVNDVLDLARLKRKELKIDLKQIDLYSTVFVVVEAFSYILNKEIKIINKIKKDTPYVVADENRLRQILYNLIDNAIKYTSHGEIVISAIQDDDKLIISVKDSGIGIPSEQLPTIFNNYERGNHLDDEQEGMGLGLSITKDLVDLQGGQIWVDSKLGEGTTFSFSLPIVKEVESNHVDCDDEQTQVIESLSLPYANGNPMGKKIIIADDNHANLRVLIEALDTTKYFIIAVDNGADVLSLLGKERDVDLLILDIMMPKMSGYEVCQIVRETYSLTELPILMLTAAILPEDMVTAFQAGANDFLHKPVDLQELHTRVNNLLLIKESARAATNMEIAFLQAQIKPHFIYNVLTSIISLSYIDIEKSRALILQFAKFLRGSFDFTNTNKLIPIQNELSLVHSYIEIEKARFPERFTFELDVKDEVSCMIPPLIIQPLVENAIRHGLSAEDAGGKIILSIQQKGEKLIITVRDNGIGMSQEKIDEIMSGKLKDGRNGVGLLNIVKRIRQFLGASISIESIEKGTKVEMILPYNIQGDRGVKQC